MEIARQRQTYAAYEFSPLLSDCRGFLLKLDGRSKTWKKRFCVLCDACLYLYVDKEAHSAIGNFLRDNKGESSYFRTIFTFMACKLQCSCIR